MQDKRSHERGPALPPVDGHHSDRRPPAETPEASYATNLLCLMPKGRRGPQLWLEPFEPGTTTKAQSAAALADVEALLPLTWLSAWNADGDRHTREANDTLHAALVARIEGLGLSTIPAVAMGRNQQWFEQGLAVQGLDDKTARALLLEFEQLGAIRLEIDGWYVLRRWAERNPQRLEYRVVSRMRRRCPMRAFEAPIDRCTVHGGPWTSSSRVAAALWRAHRSVGVSLLGCSTCQDGQQPVYAHGGNLVIDPARGVLLLRELMLGSRHGGYCFGRYTRETTMAVDAAAQHDNTDDKGEM